MNKHLESDYKMYHMVAQYLGKNKTSLHTIPGAEGVALEVCQQFEEIDKIWYRVLPSESATLRKEVDRTHLTNEMLSHITVLTAFAGLRRNPELGKELDRLPIRIKTQAADELVKRASYVHKSLEKHGKELKPWAITPVVIKEYGIRIQAFKKQIPLPQQRVKDRNAAIGRLATQMDELSRHLKLLDKLVACAPESNKDFVSMYGLMRQTLKPYTRKMALIAEVRDTDTNDPIVGCRVTLSYDKRTYKVTKTGKLLVKNIKEGKHTLTFQHTGYGVVVLPIHTTGGVTFRQTFLLKPMDSYLN